MANATTRVKYENRAVQNEDIKLSIIDVNPITPIWHILKEKTNLCILFASGGCFADLSGV
jgi:hypothetical protein